MALRQAFSLHSSGKLAEAATIYRTILASAPTQPEALHHLGLIEAASGRLEEADRLMTLSNQIVPGNTNWQFNLGRLAALKGDWGKPDADLVAAIGADVYRRVADAFVRGFSEG